MKKSQCLKTSKREGQTTLSAAGKLCLLDKTLEVKRNGDFVYIPIVKRPTKKQLALLKEESPETQISTQNFQERKKLGQSLPELLKNELPERLLKSLPRSVDFVGDIAVVELSAELDDYKSNIGGAVLKMNKNVRTVLAKAGDINGTYRLRKYTFLAGEPKTDTVHREYGCQYYVDLASAYFSPRLSFEHRRVASAVKEGETVVDLFAGVGPFSILISKMHATVRVYAVDLNPKAVEQLKKNIRLNMVIGKVHPCLADARQIVETSLSGIADRVIMNLPEKAIDFIDVACKALKPEGGIVHFYYFTNKSDKVANMKNCFTSKVQESGRKVDKILSMRHVRETAPYEWQAVIDGRIC